MTLLQVVGAAVLVGITLATLREGGGKMTVAVGIGGGVLLVGWAVTRLSGVLGSFGEMAVSTPLSPYLSLILKAIGVGYTVEVGAGICRDLGATELARRIELCGRVELLLLAIAPMTELVHLALEMAGGHA